jgi:hypothetical protein
VLTRYQLLLGQLRAEFPGFRLVRKDQSRWQRVIHLALIGITLGQMRSYLHSFHTTIGQTVYVTAAWDRCSDDERYVTLRHEAVHLRQFRRFTPLGMAIVYLVVPLPLGLAWGRAQLEKEAYAATIRAAAEVWGRQFPAESSFRSKIIGQFLGPSYGWMWPFRGALERWYDHVLATLGPATPRAAP